MTATKPTRSRTAPPPQSHRPAVGKPVPTDEDEAIGAVEGGESVGIPSVVGVLRGMAAALARPGPVTRGAGRLVRDWASIARGSDEYRPSPKDKRFADPAWSTNPAFRRLCQVYLALAVQLDRLVEDYERTAEDWHDSNAPGSPWAC